MTEEMEEMVQRGLSELVSRALKLNRVPTDARSRSQDQPLLASSLQTAHNLSVLPSLVDALVQSLTDLVSRKVKAVFDLSSLAREVGGKGQCLTRL